MKKKINNLLNEKATNNSWYGRYPVFCGNDIFFVAGNDLFKLSTGSKTPELVLQTTGNLSHLCAYDHKIACVSDEDGGPDIYLFDVKTKQLDRVTFFESIIRIVEIVDDRILFLSNKNSPFKQNMYLYKYSFKNKQVESMNIGPISWFARSDEKQDIKDAIIQKNGYGYINWKGYKGGTAGSLWQADKKLLDVPGNCMRPFIDKASNRVFFLHDDGKNGNIFSCSISGESLTQHTHHYDFHLQDLSYNRGRLIYSKNGQIGIYDISQEKDEILELKGHMPHPDMRALIPAPQKYLTSLSTDGSDLIMAIRGNVFSCGVFSGGMQKLNDELRYRISGLLQDKRKYAFKEPPESVLCIYDDYKEVKRFDVDCGKIAYCKPAPAGNLLAYVNHRHELHLIDVKTGKDEIIFKANHPLGFCDWSLGGEYLVYCAAGNVYQSKIVIYDVAEQKHYPITCGRYYDSSPTFDPEGRYIAFLSNRAIQCFHDALKFDLAFERKLKPYVISLQKNDNFLMPWKNAQKDDEEKKEKKKKAKLVIDFDKISERIVALPLKDKAYKAMHAVKDSRLLLISYANGIQEDDSEEELSNLLIENFCIKTFANEVLYKNVSYFQVELDKTHCIIEEFDKLKIVKIGEKYEEASYKKGGVFDWNRYKFPIDPKAEWRQMAYEVWYLMKEFFWSSTLRGIDWDATWKKYKPFLDNIRTKQELNDMIAEIQGELGTSHSFILNDGLEQFNYDRGYIGAVVEYDTQAKAHCIKKILPANLEFDAPNPLLAANCDIKEGDYIFAIDGVELNETNCVDQLLINKANIWVSIEFGGDKKNKSTVEVKAISSENMLHYFEWKEKNRIYADQLSNGAVGYIHVSDMQSRGFKEFFQSYLNEYDKQAIVIDMRDNRGGNVSCLLLDQLCRKRLGIDNSRWHGQFELPVESSRGSYILLINANTASDGEIFSHQFKLLGLGKVVGQRTWGGVVGIMPRYSLVDGTLTSQPEFGTWFADSGYSLENTGVSPDIEVINDIFTAQDLQLEKAVELALEIKTTDHEATINAMPHPRR